MSHPPLAAGQVYHRWTTISRVVNPEKRYDYRWLCVCACGTQRAVSVQALRNGQSQSCGCYAREVTSKIKRTHGLTGTRAYGTWNGMLSRCFNQSTPQWPHYGGRGITVCERWLKFENFYADMGDKPKGLTLERRDFDGPYCPENCYWTDWKSQANNKRNNLFLEVDGKRMTLAQAIEYTGVNAGMVHSRRKRGWPLERLFDPAKQRGPHGWSEPRLP